MNIILLGPPGSGKGTQAKKLAHYLRFPHIDTGALLRGEIEKESELGKQARTFIDNGDLVPSHLVATLIENRLLQEDCALGTVIDGFPRNLDQADVLSRIMVEYGLSLDAVIYLDVPQYVLLERLLERKRSDDNEDTIAKRIRTYKKETEPVINLFKNKNLVINIDGNNSVDEIFQDIITALKCDIK